MTPKEQIIQTAKDLGLAMESVFIPWSQSRNKVEERPTLNWQITLFRGDGSVAGGRAILTTDYSAGMAHAPSYKTGDNTVYRDERVRWECEHGKRAQGEAVIFGGKAITPDFADVLYSLVSASSVLDCSTFEEWARDLGYDTDSRKAEGIYRACLDIALKLRNGIGEDGLQKLRAATQDY